MLDLGLHLAASEWKLRLRVVLVFPRAAGYWESHFAYDVGPEGPLSSPVLGAHGAKKDGMLQTPGRQRGLTRTEAAPSRDA